MAAPARLAPAPHPIPLGTFPRLQSGVWLPIFLCFEIACQLAVLFPATSPVRPFIRTGVFGASLVLLVILPSRGQRHPATLPARWVLGIVALSFFHPHTNSPVSGAAQAGLYLAILAPLFWVPRLQIDVATLRRCLLILWAVHALGSGAGVLQAYFPGRFQPPLSPVITARGRAYVETLYVRKPTGQRFLRPMGLSDMPGGAAFSGFYAVLFGLGFFLSDRRSSLRVPCVAVMILGMMALYLSQVRSILVMLMFCIVAFCGVLAWRGERVRLAVLAGLLPTVLVLSFTWAVSIGGQVITHRLKTLVEDRPEEVYYRNRGYFLKYTLQELLPLYPAGAGLGRWGMMNAYFGDNSKPGREAIWAEIQWTGWLLDGGVPLILAYVAALAMAFRAAFKITLMQTPGDLWLWGAVIFAYNLGAFALTFTGPFFVSQQALEFWALNGALFAAVRHVRLRAQLPNRS